MAWKFINALGQIKKTGGGTTINEINDVGDVDTTGVVDGSILRYELTGTTWQATTAANLLINDAGEVLAPTLPTTGDSLTNQVFTERMDMFFA